jgi:hypothetical protein
MGGQRAKWDTSHPFSTASLIERSLLDEAMRKPVASQTKSHWPRLVDFRPTCSQGDSITEAERRLLQGVEVRRRRDGVFQNF